MPVESSFDAASFLRQVALLSTYATGDVRYAAHRFSRADPVPWSLGNPDTAVAWVRSLYGFHAGRYSLPSLDTADLSARDLAIGVTSAAAAVDLAGLFAIPREWTERSLRTTMDPAPWHAGIDGAQTTGTIRLAHLADALSVTEEPADRPGRLLLAAAADSVARGQEALRDVVSRPLPATSAELAERTKLLENQRSEYERYVPMTLYDDDAAPRLTALTLINGWIAAVVDEQLARELPMLWLDRYLDVLEQGGLSGFAGSVRHALRRTRGPGEAQLTSAIGDAASRGLSLPRFQRTRKPGISPPRPTEVQTADVAAGPHDPLAAAAADLAHTGQLMLRALAEPGELQADTFGLLIKVRTLHQNTLSDWLEAADSPRAPLLMPALAAAAALADGADSLAVAGPALRTEALGRTWADAAASGSAGRGALDRIAATVAGDSPGRHKLGGRGRQVATADIVDRRAAGAVVSVRGAAARARPPEPQRRARPRRPRARHGGGGVRPAEPNVGAALAARPSRGRCAASTFRSRSPARPARCCCITRFCSCPETSDVRCGRLPPGVHHGGPVKAAATALSAGTSGRIAVLRAHERAVVPAASRTTAPAPRPERGAPHKAPGR